MGDGKGVVKKIKFAKRWLEKAEEAYLQGKSEEGFLNLSLAEAEIRSLQKNEWFGLLGLKRPLWFKAVEVMFIALLLVFSVVSSLHMEELSSMGFKRSVILSSVDIESRACIGFKGVSFLLKLEIPNLRVQALGRLKGGLSVSKNLDAYVFYVVNKEKGKGKEEIRTVKVQELNLSTEEMLRLIELGKRELRIYLTGGR